MRSELGEVLANNMSGCKGGGQGDRGDGRLGNAQLIKRGGVGEMYLQRAKTGSPLLSLEVAAGGRGRRALRCPQTSDTPRVATWERPRAAPNPGCCYNSPDSLLATWKLIKP